MNNNCDDCLSFRWIDFTRLRTVVFSNEKTNNAIPVNQLASFLASLHTKEASLLKMDLMSSVIFLQPVTTRVNPWVSLLALFSSPIFQTKGLYSKVRSMWELPDGSNREFKFYTYYFDSRHC